ncbi:CT392 family protein [Chlamydia avium]|uniref:Uncharacterized protein n=1 Tax=Chlamydia avium TaxID=1457141 RepID=A0ABN0MSU3_9CHLA|nr:hypothetical protein [Chlamydia avium]EPP37805.1 hypothetical protein CP10743SC13_0394 [Chlamydia psittaci 10_743_SC13]EPP38592.1 hypothetical protein CP10881SC42_0482 [Chlamydia avium]
MSTIGNTGTSSPNPEDPNLAHSEHFDDESKEQVGSTESGLSVTVAVSRSLVNPSPQEMQAVLVENTARNAMQHGGAVSGLAPNANSATEAASMLANVEQESESVESFLFINQEYQELLSTILGLENRFDELCLHIEKYRDKQHTSQTRRSTRRGEDSSLVAQYQDVQRRAGDLQVESAYLVSLLSDLHKKFMGSSYDEVCERLGEGGEAILSAISSLGLEYDKDNNDWKISSTGYVPRCHESIRSLCTSIEKYEPSSSQASSETRSPLREIFQQFVELWNSLLEMFARLKQRFIFFILWLMRVVYNRLGNSQSVPTENPYAAAAFTENRGFQSSSSLRSTISGRSDVGDEEQIRRADSSSTSTQSRNEEHTKNRSNKEDKDEKSGEENN